MCAVVRCCLLLIVVCCVPCGVVSFSLFGFGRCLVFVVARYVLLVVCC